MMRQVLIIEDHSIFRTGMISVIENLPNVHITEAISVENALKLTMAPKVILLDIELPGVSGLDGINQLRTQWPDAAIIIIISAHDSYANAQEALKFGAVAFLSKADATDTILSVVSDALDSRLTDRTLSLLVQSRIANLPKLTERQIEVMQLVAKGFSNKTIGQMLHISENTIRWHVCTMISTLQVSSRTEAVFVARKLGLVN